MVSRDFLSILKTFFQISFAFNESFFSWFLLFLHLEIHEWTTRSFPEDFFEPMSKIQVKWRERKSKLRRISIEEIGFEKEIEEKTWNWDFEPRHATGLNCDRKNNTQFNSIRMSRFSWIWILKQTKENCSLNLAHIMGESTNTLSLSSSIDSHCSRVDTRIMCMYLWAKCGNENWFNVNFSPSRVSVASRTCSIHTVFPFVNSFVKAFFSLKH